jgi:hypothetical protein
MTKTFWLECNLNRLEDLEIGILDLFAIWSLGFEIYSLPMNFRPLKYLLRLKVIENRDA